MHTPYYKSRKCFSIKPLKRRKRFTRDWTQYVLLSIKIKKKKNVLIFIIGRLIIELGSDRWIVKHV